MKDPNVSSFFSKERQRFVHYVRSLLSENADLDAEDVVHDVFLRILERPDLPAADFLVAYVFRSLKNRVIDHVRAKKATMSLDLELEEGGAKLIDLLRDGKPSALEVLQTEQGRAELFEALEVLNEIERDVVTAHEFEGMPFKVMSTMWNVPINTLLSHKSRAMKKLKTQLVILQGDE